MRKTRLDALLVEGGYVESREKAKALIMAGEVRVNGQIVIKPSTVFLPEEITIEIKTPEKFVSRGGLKLEEALHFFSINPQRMRALDIGASTGGFTDCLLQHGAREVVALDVGHGQLHWKLRQNPKVQVIERKNARYLQASELGDSFDLIVMDVSFISQKLIWPQVPPLLKPNGYVIALIKPQFEVKPHEVGKGGLVRDQNLHERVKKEISDFVSQQIGFSILGIISSPIEGRDGNKEFLIGAVKKSKIVQDAFSMP